MTNDLPQALRDDIRLIIPKVLFVKLDCIKFDLLIEIVKSYAG